MCARGRQSRCSTVIAETANSAVAPLLLPVSSSWYPTQRSPVRRRRTQFVQAAVVSRLAAFAAIVALLYSRVAKLLQELCPFAFPRWTIIRNFNRCWTSGHPVRNRGSVLVRQFLTILSRLNLVQLRVRDVCHGQSMASRALILQQKTQRPVQFEITEPTRDAVSAWIKKSALNSDDFLFPSRIQESPHLSTRQYDRFVDSWVQLLGLDTTSYGTHTLRRTKATLIYRRTKNLRAVQLLLGHSKLESTVRVSRNRSG
jgi:hypothetical protein